MDYESFFATKISTLHDEGRYRVFKPIARQRGNFPRALYHRPDGQKKEVTLWCSNDYLGMGQSPIVIEAMHNAIDKYGTGAGGTRNISGTSPLHEKLEESVAKLHQKQAGLVFSSGYTANQGALAVLASLLPDCIIFSDQKNHASMIHGMKDSRAKIEIFSHNDANHLESLLKQYPTTQAKIIAFESVYSMDGDIAPVREFCNLAQRYNALTYLDEVHAVGLYGENGGGIAEQENLLDQIDIIEGTFGKAYGVMGGFITGNHVLIDTIRSYASSFIFTTSLPPAVLAGALASVEHLKTSAIERIRMRSNVMRFKKGLEKSGLPYLQGPSHIVPLIVGEPTCCKLLTDELLERYNIYVQPINYPTVPKGTERMRLTATATHTYEDIDDFVNILAELYTENHIQLAQRA